MHRRARIINTESESASKSIPGDRNLPNVVFLIDQGNFCDPADRVRMLASKGVARAMGIMGYDCVGLGLNELSLAPADLLSVLKEEQPAPLFVASNVTLGGSGPTDPALEELRKLVRPYAILAGPRGYRLGVVHIIDNTELTKGREIGQDYQVTDPVEAARTVLSENIHKADTWVLTVANAQRHGLRPEALAELTDFAVVSNVAGSNPLSGDRSTELVLPYFAEPVYDKGKELVKLALTFTKSGELRMEFTKFGVRDSYKPDPSVQQVIDELRPEFEMLQTEIAQEVLNQMNTALERPVYLGYQACYECHKPIVDQLMLSGHMHAYETLRAIGREHEECAKCHNVGFNQPGGWNVIEDRKFAAKQYDRRNVQCENCHGPGDYHVLLARGSELPSDFQAEGRNEFGLQDASEKTCVKCHFGDNDPHFNFKTYWPKIAHGNSDVATDSAPVTGHVELEHSAPATEEGH